jgi:hypothetical protein
MKYTFGPAVTMLIGGICLSWESVIEDILHSDTGVGQTARCGSLTSSSPMRQSRLESSPIQHPVPCQGCPCTHPKTPDQATKPPGREPTTTHRPRFHRAANSRITHHRHIRSMTQSYTCTTYVPLPYRLHLTKVPGIDFDQAPRPLRHQAYAVNRVNEAVCT